jgi:hypothetical protein
VKPAKRLIPIEIENKGGIALSRIGYEHLTVKNNSITEDFVYFALITKNKYALSKLYDEIAQHNFPFRYKPFLFNDFVMVIAERGEH